MLARVAEAKIAERWRLFGPNVTSAGGGRARRARPARRAGRLWMVEVQRLADETGLELEVRHLRSPRSGRQSRSAARGSLHTPGTQQRSDAYANHSFWVLLSPAPVPSAPPEDGQVCHPVEALHDHRRSTGGTRCSPGGQIHAADVVVDKRR